MDAALITDTRQIMRNRLHGRILSPSHSLCQHWYLCAWNTASCLPAPDFHLLMIQAVFSASGDNVLSALWEISVFWRDSLDLFGMSLLLSPSLFLSLRSFPKFLFCTLLFFYPTFLLTPLAILSFSISPVFLRFFFFFRASQRRVRTPISLLHTLLTFRPSPPSSTPLPPSRLHPHQHQVNSPLPNIHSHRFPFFSSTASPSPAVFLSRCYHFQFTLHALIFRHPSFALPLSALSPFRLPSLPPPLSPSFQWRDILFSIL